jgi:hypothetical protein
LWEGAENKIREWVVAGRFDASVSLTTIEDAVKLFLAEAESRNLAEASRRALPALHRPAVIAGLEEARHEREELLGVGELRRATGGA